MEKGFYSIYDKKMERYNLPGIFEDDREVMIVHQRALKDKSAFLYINADDLAIYCCGKFDDKTGVITTLKVPRLVCDVSSLIKED